MYDLVERLEPEVTEAWFFICLTFLAWYIVRIGPCKGEKMKVICLKNIHM